MYVLQHVQVDVEKTAPIAVAVVILRVIPTVQTDVVVAVCSAAIQLVKNRVLQYVLIHAWVHVHMNALVQKAQRHVKDALVDVAEHVHRLKLRLRNRRNHLNRLMAVITHVLHRVVLTVKAGAAHHVQPAVQLRL